MSKFKILFLIIAFLIPFSLIPSKAVAQSKYEDVNIKDGSRYFLKRIKEKTALLLLSYNSQKKINYYKKLLDIRLSELKYVVDNKDITNIQTASQRYFTTAGQLTNLLLSKSQLSSNKESVKKLFEEHIKTLEILKNAYDNTTAEWRFLRDDINYLHDYSSSLK